MNTLLKSILAITAVIAFNIHAQSIPVAGIEINRMHSEQGDSLDKFASDVGLYLQAWTEKNNAEACGVITENDRVYYVIISTNYSQISCRTNSIITGSTVIGVNIHSHPHCDATSHIRITEATHKAEPDIDPQQSSMFVNTRNFSQTDYKNGAGYLVADHRLLFQTGRGTMKVIATNFGE